jgi:hypothetical protein
MIYSSGSIQKVNDTVIKELDSHCNACPYITFQPNKVGFIERPDQKQFPFKWQIEGNKLIFINYAKDSEIVRNGAYLIKFSSNRKVKLIDSISKRVYYLD